MFSDTLTPVKDVANRAGDDVWCVVANATYSNLSVLSQVESMNAVSIELISAGGKEMVVVNVEPKRDTERQFEKYTVACETVKNIFEAVVTTSY